jgi:hypothetical protein
MTAIFIVAWLHCQSTKAPGFVEPERREVICASFKVYFGAAAAAGIPFAGRQESASQPPAARVAMDREGIEPAALRTASVVKDRSTDQLALGRLQEEHDLALRTNGTCDRAG